MIGQATKKKLLTHLLQFVSENKQRQFDANIMHRTRYITLALEDIFQPQNASAVLRTCDCLGIQDVHIIEGRNSFTPNPDVALGASKWLDLHRYNGSANNSEACIRQLRENGYRIIATSPHANAISLDKLNIDSKLALFFGTEMHGLSDAVLETADEHVTIPMYGFTESYNLSVSAAICLYLLIHKIKSTGRQWQLSAEELTDIRLSWAKQAIKKPDAIIHDFLSKQGKEPSN